MNPEERKMLEEALALSRENNEIVKKIWRSAQIGRAIKIFYWLLIIGVTVGSLYFIKPYLEVLQGAYGGGGNLEEVSKNYQDLFKF